MADQDTTVDSEVNEQVDTSVETQVVEDESVTTSEENQDDTETGHGEDDQEDTEGEQTETVSDEEPKLKKRFTQLKGDTPEEYIKSLEEAYRNSTVEFQKLNQDLKSLKKDSDSYNKVLELVANNPDVARALEKAGGKIDEPPKKDPALEYAREQLHQQLTKEYRDFTELHPEVLEDEVLRKELFEELEIVDQIYAARGRKLTMTEGLKRAWANLGKDEEDSKEKVMSKAKETAAKPGASGTAKKGESKPQFTDSQLRIAKKMGVSAEQLAKYSK